MKKELKELENKNLFMMCKKLNDNALSELSVEYNIRNCRKKELDIWKAFPFDDQQTAHKYYEFMTHYFETMYLKNEELFYEKSLFVCDKNDKPIGTCFVWKAYNEINTIHWFKVLKEYEGMGIGRALLSIVMKSLKKDDFPVYLHTQPLSYKAIKLYSDFGFSFLSDKVIGSRQNDLDECLPELEKYMPLEDFINLRIIKSPKHFLKVVSSSSINQF